MDIKHFECDGVGAVFKAAAYVVDQTDQACLEAIHKYAKDNGINSLITIDKARLLHLAWIDEQLKAANILPGACFTEQDVKNTVIDQFAALLIDDIKKAIDSNYAALDEHYCLHGDGPNIEFISTCNGKLLACRGILETIKRFKEEIKK